MTNTLSKINIDMNELKNEIEIELINMIKCPRCGKDITVFKDEIAENEYRRSGLCQQCQDELYDEIEEISCCGNHEKK